MQVRGAKTTIIGPADGYWVAVRLHDGTSCLFSFGAESDAVEFAATVESDGSALAIVGSWAEDVDHA
jgi:hypothetical protein